MFVWMLDKNSVYHPFANAVASWMSFVLLKAQIGLDNWQFNSAIQFPLFLIRSSTVHFSCCFFPHHLALCLVTVCSFHVYVYLICILHFCLQLFAVCCCCTDSECYRSFREISHWLFTPQTFRSLLPIVFCSLFSSLARIIIINPIPFVWLSVFHSASADLITHKNKWNCASFVHFRR